MTRTRLVNATQLLDSPFDDVADQFCNHLDKEYPITSDDVIDSNYDYRNTKEYSQEIQIPYQTTKETNTHE